MNSNPDISIIVPIYNVEEYLEECLESLKNQTKTNIEIIMVDDDTPDSSGEIAKRYAENYPNFLYFHKENGGLGCARNFGVKQANGKYIAFIDSDDTVSVDLYEKMFNAAEKNNSDLTICNVVRCNSLKIWESSLHSRVFKNIEPITHITQNSDLLNDTTSWNKLILRSFYENNNFSFPENILYEDIPVTIPMHLLANNVSVVEDSYYFWRVRDGATKSITQNTGKLKNLYDRIKIMKMLDRFFIDNNINQELSKQKQKKALEIDLMIFINTCNSLSEELSLEVLKAINEYIDEAIDEDVFCMIPLIDQQKYAYARNYDIENLLKILQYQKQDYYNAEVKEIDGRFIATLPDELFTIKGRDITNELSRIQPKNGITDLEFNDNCIIISSYIYTRRVNIKDNSELKVTCYLQNDSTNKLTELEVEQFSNNAITKRVGRVFDASTNKYTDYNYDGSAFKIKIDFNTLDEIKANKGCNKILICYENKISSGKILLTGFKRLSANNGAIFKDKHIQIIYNSLKQFCLYVNKTENVATKFSIDNGKLYIGLENPTDELYSLDEYDNRLSFDKYSDYCFSLDCDKFEIDKSIKMYAVRKGKESGLLYKDKRIFLKNKQSPSFVIMTNVNHYVRIIAKDSITSINSIYQSKNKLYISTSVADDIDFTPNNASIFVEDKYSGDRLVLAESKCTNSNKHFKCKFKINFNNKDITGNLYSGSRDIFIAYENDGKELSVDKIYSAKYYNEVLNSDDLEISFIRATNGNLKLKSTLHWKENENTLQKRRTLLARNYPKYLEEPIDPYTIVFESMWGAKYSCSCQYIYEYIDKNYPQYKCVWSLNDPKTPINGNGIRVRRGSLEYYHYLATAKYLFNNVNYPDEYQKRDGQIEVQTMHGTPLKTLGLEVPGDFPNELSRKQYINKNKRWDYLIVQGEFMKNKAYDCFKYDKEILECGYPRTDNLFNASEDKKIKLKKQLNIPLDKKVILYTPTWRRKGSFDLELNIEKMRKALSDEYVLLIRLHHLCAQNPDFEEDRKFVFDLKDYRSVEDLYLITDILITDYSSVMFDFALLNKPMLFYTYDLEDYRDNLRGMYVDIEKEAPGPLLFTTSEVINAIKNIDEEMNKCKDKIDLFKKKYLTYENADSCKTVVDTVIHPKPASKNNKTSFLKLLFKKLSK